MFGIYDINTNTTLGYKQRFDIYKKVGFEGVAFFIDDSYYDKNENFLQLIEYALEIGLKIMQVHADYKISNLICDESTNEYFDYLESRLKICDKYKIKSLVVHASKGDNPPVISDIQLEKLKNLANSYPYVNLCYENVRSNENLEKILNLNVKNIGMCYDLGHAHVYSDENKLFERNKKHILCSHLHNNYGKDTHNLLPDGEILWKDIVGKLKKMKCENCLEVFPGHDKILSDDEFTSFVEKAYKDIEE